MVRNPWNLIKKVTSFMTGGIMDSLASRSTGRPIDFGQRVAARLNDCEPWVDHYEHSTLIGINKAYKDRDFEACRTLLAIGVREGADSRCVELANLAVDLLAAGREVSFDLFYCLE